MNYAELTQQIKDYCEYEETDFVAGIPDFVKKAEEHIFRTVQLPCARKEATGSCVISNEELNVPSDYFWPLTLALTISGAKIPLLNKEPDFLTEAYGGNVTGTPLYYAQKSDTKLMLAPLPSTTFAYTLTYHGLPTSIVSSSTSWLGTFAQNALLYGSLIHAGVFMRQDTEWIQTVTGLYQEAVTQLADQGNFKIRRDTFKTRDKKPDEE